MKTANLVLDGKSFHINKNQLGGGNEETYLKQNRVYNKDLPRPAFTNDFTGTKYFVQNLNFLKRSPAFMFGNPIK